MAWRGRRLGLALGAACLAALAGVQFWTRPGRRAAYAVCFAPRGDRVAAITEGEPEGSGRLRIWDMATGRQITSAIVPDRPLSLAYAPDGSTVATGGWNGTVLQWEPASGRLLRSFPGHSTPVRGLAFLPDGRILAAGASDGRILFWDVASGRERMQFDRGHRLPVNGMAISHDGRYLAAAGGLGAKAVSLWSLETKQPLTPASLATGGEPVAFATDRAILAMPTTTPAGSVWMFDLDADRAISAIPAGGARSLTFSPDGRLVAIGGDDETVTVLESGTGRAMATYGGHRHPPDPLSNDLRHLMADAGLAERRVQNTVWSVAFSPDGTRLASAGQDGSVWLWSFEDRGAGHAPGRALLPRPGRPGWLPGFQVAALLAALVLFMLASGARDR
jgi:WD40 repeat protein